MKKPAAAFDDLDQEGNAAPTGRRKSSDRGDSAGASWDGFDEELMRARPEPRVNRAPGQPLSNKELMDYTGVHFTTVYRWRRQQKLPGHIEKLLKFVALKELDQFEGWEGWKIINRTLISPSGGNYNTGDVDAIQIRKTATRLPGSRPAKMEKHVGSTRDRGRHRQILKTNVR